MDTDDLLICQDSGVDERFRLSIAFEEGFESSPLWCYCLQDDCVCHGTGPADFE